MSFEVGIDVRNLSAMTDFWAYVLGYVRGYNDDDTYRDLVPPTGDGPTVFLQRVDETKTSKNRMHIDVYDYDPQNKVDGLLRMGATALEDAHSDGDWWWQVMADPEGNEFCVCRDFAGRKGESAVKTDSDR